MTEMLPELLTPVSIFAYVSSGVASLIFFILAWTHRSSLQALYSLWWLSGLLLYYVLGLPKEGVAGIVLTLLVCLGFWVHTSRTPEGFAVFPPIVQKLIHTAPYVLLASSVIPAEGFSVKVAMLAVCLNAVFTWSMIAYRYNFHRDAQALYLVLLLLCSVGLWLVGASLNGLVEVYGGASFVWGLVLGFGGLLLLGGLVSATQEKSKFLRMTREVEHFSRQLQNSQNALTQSNEALRSALAEARQRSELAQSYEDELRRQNSLRDKDRSRLLAQIIHDLRQPVQAISLSLHAIIGKLYVIDQQDVRDNLQLVQRSVTLLSRQMSALLQLSKLEAGSFKPHIQYTRVADVLTSVLQQNDLRARQRGVVLDTKQLSVEVAVDTDPEMLFQILDNLVSNAIKYSDQSKADPPFVRIEVGVQGDSDVVISVIDNGIGIPAEFIQSRKVFEPFFQLNNELPETEKGVGLGLSIVAAQVDVLERHSLNCSSEFGVGSCFSLTLPMASAEAAPIARQYMTFRQKSLADVCVWVVEDDHMVREALRRLLSAQGAKVTTFSSYRELELYLGDTTVEPDMVLSDFRLPAGRTAVDVVQLCLANGVECPCIIITGEDLMIDLRSLSSTRFELLRKPVDPVELLECIELNVRVT